MNATPSPVLPPVTDRTRTAALALGAVGSAALLAGSFWVIWLAWAAVAVALVAGAVAVWATVSAARAQRAAADAEARAERGDHRDAIRRVHEAQREVLAVVDARTRTLRRDLNLTRAALGEACQEVDRLNGVNATLRRTNDRLRSENADLHSRIVAVTPDTAGAEVLALPRRRAGQTAAADEWSVLEAPTVIDLDLARLANPFVEELRRNRA